jgi:hypothetical protein
MMFQLFLKPRIPGPLPLRMRQRLAAVRAAIHLALQEYELPIAQLLLFFAVNTSSAQNLIHSGCKPAQRTLRQESRRKRKLFQMIQLHDYLHDNFLRRKRTSLELGRLGLQGCLSALLPGDSPQRPALQTDRAPAQMEVKGSPLGCRRFTTFLGFLAQNASHPQCKAACRKFLSNIGRA